MVYNKPNLLEALTSMWKEWHFTVFMLKTHVDFCESGVEESMCPNRFYGLF